MEKAKELLNANDIESQIEKKALELKILNNWLDYTNEDSNLSDNNNIELQIIRQVLKGHGKIDNYTEQMRTVGIIYDKMEDKHVKLKMDETIEMEAFCQLIETGLTYDLYEEALHTTKKGKVLLFT